jgi:hypothetical protein
MDPNATPPFYDVNNDGYVVAGDALEVINWLNAHGSGTSYIDGLVYLDLDNDGVADVSDPRLQGVTVHVDGTDASGNPVHQTLTTDAAGRYRFNHSGSDYTVTEQSPNLLPDGQETESVRYTTIPSGTNDQFSVAISGGNGSSADNNFGELVPSFAAGQTTGDGLVIAATPLGSSLWNWRLSGWRNVATVQVLFDDQTNPNPSSATLKVTDTFGTLHTIRIHQDPTQNTEAYYPPGMNTSSGPHFSVLSSGSGYRVLRLVGTAAQFGLNLRPR